MTTWILILAFSNSISRAGQQIHSVPGFKTQESCLVAGNAFINQQKDRNTGVTALCVRSD